MGDPRQRKLFLPTGCRLVPLGQMHWPSFTLPPEQVSDGAGASVVTQRKAVVAICLRSVPFGQMHWPFCTLPPEQVSDGCVGGGGALAQRMLLPPLVTPLISQPCARRILALSRLTSCQPLSHCGGGAVSTQR